MRKRVKRQWTSLVLPVALLCMLSVALLCVLNRSQTGALVASPGSVTAPVTAGMASVYTSQRTIQTYNYDNYLYDQHNPTYNMNYKRLDWGAFRGNMTRSARIYDIIVMENDYLALTIIPSLGGRVYSMVFKPTGHNEFYSNWVIKPTHWGPPEQGWWLAAGGMEWCLPVDEHGYEWGVPWDATMSTDADGVNVVLVDTTRTDRLRAVITLHLPHDKSYLSVTPRIENPTAAGVWYKYWTNVQVAPGAQNTLSADFRFILPIDQVTVHSSGAYNNVPSPGEAMSWPVYQGRDWSRLGNWESWLGFFARPAAARDFQGVYDYQVDEGLARVFPSNVARGAKGFAWGWEHAYPAGEWTDGAPTYYAEIHGGIAPTFWDHAYLPPGGAIQWTESWYPVAGIGGLSVATADAALNLSVNGSQVTIGAQPTTPRPEGVIALWRPGEVAPLYRAVATLTPGSPHKATLALGGDLSGLVLVYLDGSGNLLATTEPTPESQPPGARVSDLPPYVTSTAPFVVSWSGSDSKSCVLDYDVQFKDGYDGPWTDWLTRTTSTSSPFSGGEHGHTYFFRARARDLYGNVGPYGDDEWGQAFTSVLTSPMPVLVTSRKWVNRIGAIGGDVLTYTLSMRNTGNDSAGSVWLTDTLPAEITLLTDTVRVTDGGPVTYTNGELTWHGTVTEQYTVEVTFAAQVIPSVTLVRPVSNTMYVDHQGTVFSRQTSFILGHCTFFPLIFQSGSP